MSGVRYPQFCALARAAEIVGERWTLLIVRELLLGPKRFVDLKDRLSDVSPTVLTGRLAALTEHGVVRKATLPQFNVHVYELTPAGLALKPAIRELIRWGGYFLFPMRPDDEFEPDWVLLGLDAITRQTPSPAEKILLRVPYKHKSASFLVEGGPQGTTIERSDAPAQAMIEAKFDVVLKLVSGQTSIEQAVASRQAKIEGPIRSIRLFPQLFDMPSRS